MGLGIRGMVLSVTCFITLPVGIFIALPAWVTGSEDMKKINAGKWIRQVKGIRRRGVICGIIGTILWLITLLLIVV